MIDVASWNHAVDLIGLLGSQQLGALNYRLFALTSLEEIWEDGTAAGLPVLDSSTIFCRFHATGYIQSNMDASSSSANMYSLDSTGSFSAKMCGF